MQRGIGTRLHRDAGSKEKLPGSKPGKLAADNETGIRDHQRAGRQHQGRAPTETVGEVPGRHLDDEHRQVIYRRQLDHLV